MNCGINRAEFEVDLPRIGLKFAIQRRMSELTAKQLGERIYIIRGRRVMLDSDLAELYSVETKNLNKAVQRNLDRFPDDFMFKVTSDEMQNLRFQFGTSSLSYGGRRTQPYVFTQEGVAMLSGVLRSGRAIQANIAIMRTFVRLREILETNKDLALKLEKLESRYDHQFKAIFDAIRQLMAVGSPITQKKIRPIDE